MQLRVVHGRSGAGKTDFIIEQIVQAQRQGKRCLLIVPEQATHETEQRLLHALSGGLLGVEVLSLTRLVQRVFQEQGGANKIFLETEGKLMVLRKLIQQHSKELEVYASMSTRSGFAQKLDEMITRFKFSQITPERLAAAKADIPDAMLKRKIGDIAVIYQALEEYMGNNFIDAQDMQNLFIQKMADSKLVKDVDLFIDSFNSFEFTVQDYEAIGNLVRYAKRVTITFCFGRRTDDDFSIFESEYQAAHKMMNIARSNHADVDMIGLPNETQNITQRKVPDGVDLIEKQLFAINQVGKQKGDVKLLEAINRKEEVEQAIIWINSLLRNGVRMDQITVAAGDLEAYAPLVRRAFSKNNLDFFIDERRSLASHRAVEYVLGSLSAAYSMRAEDILRVAKTGFSVLDFRQTQRLENYAIKFGIKFRGFLQEFDKEDKRDGSLHCDAENARQLLMTPIIALQKALRKAKRAKEQATALYDYLLETGLKERIVMICEQLQQANHYDLAAENAQVWNAIIKVLEQVALLLEGDMGTKQFITVLEEGFAANEIAVIPPTTDQITVGGLQRICTREVQNLIVLGLNEGLIPRAPQEKGIINDADSDMLKSVGIEAFLPSRNYMLYERHLVYKCLSRPKKSLFMSYAQSDSSGKRLEPSPLVFRLRQMISNIDYQKKDVFEAIGTEKEGILQLSVGLRDLIDQQMTAKQNESLLAELYAYFAGSAQKNPAHIQRIKDSLFEESSGFDPQYAKALFSQKSISSVTRIEEFNQCPYKHFIRYGIVPQERKTFEEARVDQGNYYHEAFHLFTKEMIDRNIDTKNMTQTQAYEIFDEILDNVELEHNNALLKTMPKFEQTAKFMRRTAKKTLWAMISQIAAGSFAPRYAEARIGEDLPPVKLKLKDGSHIVLKGSIDRIDLFEHEGQAYVRIIDYKLAETKIDYSFLLNGIKLQLPLYMHCTQTLGDFGGMFYMQVHDPMFKVDQMKGELAPYKLNGIMLASDTVADAMDAQNQAKSEVLAIKRNRDGELQGSILQQEQIDLLIGFAVEKARETAEKILAGENTPFPAKRSDFEACQICDYRSICRFEPHRSNQYHQLSQINQDEFFGFLEGEEIAQQTANSENLEE